MKTLTKKNHRLNSMIAVILLATVLIGFSCTNSNKNKHHGKDRIAIAKADSGIIEGTVTDCKDSLLVIQAYGDTAVTRYMLQRINGKVIHGLNTGLPLLTIDTIKISDGKFVYRFHTEKPKNIGLALIGKDGKLQGICFQNPYMKRPYYWGGTCIVLNNNKITINISGKDIQHATIKGSPEMDKTFKKNYENDSKAAAKVQETQDKFNKLIQGKITNYNVIKTYSTNRALLEKIYNDRALYHSTDSLYTIYMAFDHSLQVSPLGKKLLAYIDSTVK